MGERAWSIACTPGSEAPVVVQPIDGTAGAAGGDNVGTIAIAALALLLFSTAAGAVGMWQLRKRPKCEPTTTEAGRMTHNPMGIELSASVEEMKTPVSSGINI